MVETNAVCGSCKSSLVEVLEDALNDSNEVTDGVPPWRSVNEDRLGRSCNLILTNCGVPFCANLFVLPSAGGTLNVFVLYKCSYRYISMRKSKFS